MARWLHGVDGTAGRREPIGAGPHVGDGPLRAAEEALSRGQDAEHQGQQETGPRREEEERRERRGGQRREV